MAVVREDDTNLKDDDILWRRILDYPNQWFTFKDGVLRASSAAFKDGYDNETSVNVASMTTVEQVLKGRDQDGLVSVPVGLPRSLKHIVAKTLDPGDPTEPSHRVICPPPGLVGKRRGAAARTIARAAAWIVLPRSQRQSSG